MPASDIVEAQWVAERRGLERFRTEQPPYSILSRSIEREVLPVAQRYGMGTSCGARSGRECSRPRPQGPAPTARARVVRPWATTPIDAVEQLIPLAEEAGLR